MIHRIKLNEIYSDDVYWLRKTAEVRVNDRNYKVGDYILFQTVSKCNSEVRIDHPVNNDFFRIDYVLPLDGFFYDVFSDPLVLLCIVRVLPCAENFEDIKKIVLASFEGKEE